MKIYEFLTVSVVDLKCKKEIILNLLEEIWEVINAISYSKADVK